MQSYKTTLSKKTTLAEGVFLLHFVLTPPGRLSFIPGQYIILSIPQNDTFVKRLYSIASPSSQTDSFDLLIKQVPGGTASSFIQKIQVGQVVEVTGPAGLFSLKNSPQTKVFLTTGSGIAPVRSFVLSTPTHSQPYYLFWGLPFYKEVYLFEELKERAQKDPFFHPVICLSRESSLDLIPVDDRSFFCIGHIDVAAGALITSQPQNSLEYYICGRREVVESTREYLYNKNVGRDVVFFERY